MNSKILIQGGLGNQMFQIAFAFNRKQVERKPIVVCLKQIKPCIYFNYKPFYKKNLILGFVITILRKLNSNSYLKYFPSVKTINDYQSPEIISLNIQRFATYEGTFGSIFYFQQFQNEVKNLFTLKKKYIDEYNFLIGFQQLQQKTVVLHIRRTDYKNFGNQNFGGKDLSLPNDYYINCLKKIKNLDEYNIYIIGDDIKGIDQEFTFINVHLLHFSEIIDFQIIMNADIVIAANSTFSWWASYLNKKAEKIYMPKYWLGFHLKKLMPELIYYDKPTHWELVE